MRQQIVALALLQHHKLYVHGNMGPDTFDCAGLVWYLYDSICGISVFSGGIGLSTTTKIMTSTYGRLTLFPEKALYKDLHLLKIGDVLLFHRQSLADHAPREDNKYPGHCGIYLGQNRFIHASYPKQQVVISNFEVNPYWCDVLVGRKDFITEQIEQGQKIARKIGYEVSG